MLAFSFLVPCNRITMVIGEVMHCVPLLVLIFHAVVVILCV